MQHVNAMFGFGILIQLCENSFVALPYARHKQALPWQQILRQKLLYAFLGETTRMWWLITGGFRGKPMQRRHFWLQGCKGRCHGNQILAKIGKKSNKNGYNFSYMWDINAEFSSDIGLQLPANSSRTFPHTRDKVPLPWQPILGRNWDKIAINVTK